MISPCVDVFRKVARHLENELGSAQGSRHTTPDLKRDIDCIMKSLKDNLVYSFTEGRAIDEDDKIVPDVISVGIGKLTDPSPTNPLKEYNRAFITAQQRRRMLSISDLANIADVVKAATSLQTSSMPSDTRVPNQNSIQTEHHDIAQPDNEPDNEQLFETPQDGEQDNETLRCDDEQDVALEMDAVDDNSDSDADYDDE